MRLVIAALLGAACGDDTRSTAETTMPSVETSVEVVVETTALSPDEFIAGVAEQRAKWAAAGLDTYEFTLSWRVFSLLTGDYRVTVVDGQPAAINRVGSTAADLDSLDELPGSIDEVFDRLERQVGAERVDVRYDPDLGYPVSVRVDRDLDSVDDELEFRVSDVTVTTT